MASDITVALVGVGGTLVGVVVGAALESWRETVRQRNSEDTDRKHLKLALFAECRWLSKSLDEQREVRAKIQSRSSPGWQTALLISQPPPTPPILRMPANQLALLDSATINSVLQLRHSLERHQMVHNQLKELEPPEAAVPSLYEAVGMLLKNCEDATNVLMNTIKRTLPVAAQTENDDD